MRSLLSLVLAVLLSAACRSSNPPPNPSRPAERPPEPTPAVPVPTPEPPPPTPAPLETSQVAPPPAAEATAPSSAAPPPAASVPPQGNPPPAPSDRPYADILRLKQAGFSDEFLLNKIRTDNVRYELTTGEILDLRAAGLSETVLAAMLRSGQSESAVAGKPVARRAEFPGIARVGKSVLGIFGTSTKSVGRLVVDGEKISWYETQDPSKNFEIYSKNVKEIFNTCVLHPGENLCLELGIVTFTGEEYRFREPGWKRGDNRVVTEATTFFRQAFPNVFFSQRTVSEM